MRLMLILFIAIFNLPSAHAADSGVAEDIPVTSFEVRNWERRVEKRDADYDFNLIQLKKSNADYFRSGIRSLRNLYAFTSYYEPFSDRLVDEMTQYAYTVQNSKDSIRVNNSLKAYKELVDKHIANIAVLNFAITMARVNALFGNPAYYERAREAVYAGITAGVDGNRPQTAYNIVVRDEELMILARKGYEIEKSEVYDVNGTYYNVYDVRDENGEFDQVFMNITKPVKVSYIKKYLARKQQTYTIPGME